MQRGWHFSLMIWLVASLLGACRSGGLGSEAGDGRDGGSDAAIPDMKAPPEPCRDQRQGQQETDVDCGGGTCAACADGKHCSHGDDCQSQSCLNNICVAPSCNDDVKNGMETGIDCGGDCEGCLSGQPCQVDSDCRRGLCANRVCKSTATGISLSSSVEARLPAPATSAIASGDLNQDGKPDLVVLQDDWDSQRNQGDAWASILNGNGDGSFTFAMKMPVQGRDTNHATVAIVDINNDGLLDFFSLYGSIIQTALGEGEGSFAPLIISNPIPGVFRIALGDLDHDGYPDVVQGYGWVLFGTSTGHFQQRTHDSSILQADPALGDINQDGNLDVVVYDPQAGALVSFMGNSDGTLQTPQMPFAVADALQNNYLIAADINNDHWLDAILAYGTSAQPGSVAVFMGNGDGSFQPQHKYPMNDQSGISGLAVEDLDQDGFRDIALLTRAGGIIVYLNQGDGTFGSPRYFTVPLTNDTAICWTVTDVNGDGRVDFVVATSAGNVIVTVNAPQ